MLMDPKTWVRATSSAKEKLWECELYVEEQ